MLATLKHRVAADLERQEAGSPSFRRYGVAGLLAGLAVVAGAVTGGSSFVSHLPGAWFFGTPGGPLGFVSSSSSRPPALSVLAVYGGLGAMGAVWWRLYRAVERRRGVPVRTVVRVAAAWAAPFVMAPPLFSRDVYSYAGQGLMVQYHINPYLYGPGVLGASRFNLLAGPLWANTPSPYGPTFLSVDGLAAQLSHHEVLVDLLLLRLVAVASVALVVASLPTLARSVGRDPAATVVLGGASPLVLATLVGGAHNDALMMGLLVAGLAAWRRLGPVPGIVLCALAAGVKAPAALGVVVIGWNWASDARLPERFTRTLGALGIGAATLAAESAVTGVGWGWLLTFTASDKVSTGVTPVDALAKCVSGVLHLAGDPVGGSSVRSVLSVVGVVLAVAVGTYLLWRSPRLGPMRALGSALLVLALLGPVLWAWYVTWGLVLLAPCSSGWLRRAVVWLSVVEALVGAGSVVHLWDAFAGKETLPLSMVALGVVAATGAALCASYEARPVRWRAMLPASVRAALPAGGTRAER